MNTKRRDKKGRVLRTGESQRADGRYAFVYTDSNKKQKFVYSWKLEETDALPAGKKPCVALRTQEKSIVQMQEFGLVDPGSLTVIELMKRYMSVKFDTKPTTRQNYLGKIRVLDKYGFMHRRIKDIKTVEAKQFVRTLCQEGKTRSTIKGYITVIRSALDMAVEEEMLLRNPFCFKIASIVPDTAKKRDALTSEQVAHFLQFLRENAVYRKYYNFVVVLLHTGLRVSELCALTRDDVNFETKCLMVNKQVIRLKGAGLQIAPPKTKKANRVIPLTEEALVALQDEISKNHSKSDVIFTSRKGHLRDAPACDEIFGHMCAAYNTRYPEHKLKVTPHICRHTYCSAIIQNGMRVATVQYIMGHSQAAVTLDVYTHVTLDSAQKELEASLKSIGSLY